MTRAPRSPAPGPRRGPAVAAGPVPPIHRYRSFGVIHQFSPHRALRSGWRRSHGADGSGRWSVRCLHEVRTREDPGARHGGGAWPEHRVAEHPTPATSSARCPDGPPVGSWDGTIGDRPLRRSRR